MNQISNAGINLIKKWEICILHPYLDGYGYPTIGWGTRFYPNGQEVKITDPAITQAAADQYLEYIIEKTVDWINTNITCTLNQNQFDAMCSFFYNVGTDGFKQKNPNTWNALQSCNLAQFAKNMLLFIHVGNQVSQGLVNRRNAEYNLFNS